MVKLLPLAIILFFSNLLPAQSDTWKVIADSLGRTGKEQPGGIYKVGFPRSDMHVTVEGVVLKPSLALGSWLAFIAHGANEVMVMGDLVLSEDEVGPVMQKLQQGGIQQTALHNHLLHETPRVMYMHVSGHGDPAKIATALRAALALTGTPTLPSPAPTAEIAAFDPRIVNNALGRKGTPNGGVLQFSVPRAEKITDADVEIPPSMGTATAINFQPTSSGKAAITGDFVLLGDEVNPVIRALRDGGIQVTAIHSHMLSENPRLFYMHFWANDDAVKLATALKTAIAKTNSMPGDQQR
jgi:hypothetical protein